MLRYKKWSESLEVLLCRSYPDAFPWTKRNLFNIVAALNRSETIGINFLSRAVGGTIQSGFEFRWGVVPVLSKEQGQKMGPLFCSLIKDFGRGKIAGFFKKVSQIQFLTDSPTPSVNWSTIRSEHDTLILTESHSENFVPRDLDTVIEYDVSGSGELRYVFMNGIPFDMDVVRLWFFSLSSTSLLCVDAFGFLEGYANRDWMMVDASSTTLETPQRPPPTSTKCIHRSQVARLF
ncbi:hypothetical protein JAAARDRAFT_200966 [Jaapia argillacea MUCL 33604]|uniref:UGGT thioredoxin-like domain-containing protein n=1 Tax=Jaapia argillacea MUCL 33604 TaxID=933084 RepID=A0A067P672_9AGAM|nr:hypothetical protein JAAARDRAFT_200966 [Jaapia argillacea MUCL 33604]